MITLTKNMTSAVCVFLLSLLPAIVYAESSADRRSDTSVETWNNQDIELERAILTEKMSPTAAGPASAEQHGAVVQESMHGESNMGKDDMAMGHGMKQYKSASHYKREVFGND